jgi:hypothetical protein
MSILFDFPTSIITVLSMMQTTKMSIGQQLMKELGSTEIGMLLPRKYCLMWEWDIQRS